MSDADACSCASRYLSTYARSVGCAVWITMVRCSRCSTNAESASRSASNLRRISVQPHQEATNGRERVRFHGRVGAAQRRACRFERAERLAALDLRARRVDRKASGSHLELGRAYLEQDLRVALHVDVAVVRHLDV